MFLGRIQHHPPQSVPALTQFRIIISSLLRKKTMKKNLTTNLAKSDLLRPIDHFHKPVTFRTIIKCRNQSSQPLELEKHQSQSHIRSVQEQLSNSVDPVELNSKDQSPVKQLVKEHLKKPSLNLATTHRSDRPKAEVIDPSNESKIGTCSRLQDSLMQSIEAKSASSVEELRKRVENLLQLNLQRCRLIKGKGEISQWLEQKKALEVEAELMAIQQGLKSIKQDELNLTDILARIEIIESAMAGQTGQSQSLKRSYYSKKNQFYNTTSHLNKHALRQSLKLNSKYNISITACQQILKKEVLKCSSSSNEFYKAPRREDYISPVKNIRKYEPNRCQLPTSSYNKEFLNYQSFPTFPKQLPGGKSLPNATLTVKTSTYQNQFNDKLPHSKLIDYHELDCAKNKLKNINISFVESSRKPKQKIVSKEGKKKTKVKENEPRCEGVNESMGRLQSLDQFYQTEQRRNFGDKRSDKESELYRSIPKNRQLLRLKQNFRLLAQAL